LARAEGGRPFGPENRVLGNPQTYHSRPRGVYITNTQTVATAPLQQGDNLTYDGNVSSASAAGLEGFGNAMAPAGTSQGQLSSYADYGSINLINGYAGTVTLAPDSAGQLAVMTLTVTSGTLAQQADGAESQAQGQAKPQGTSGSTGGATSTDLTVYGALDWTGGTVGGPNSASVPPLAPANVNLEGGRHHRPGGGRDRSCSAARSTWTPCTAPRPSPSCPARCW
jgi:hypothetical protein